MSKYRWASNVGWCLSLSTCHRRWFRFHDATLQWWFHCLRASLLRTTSHPSKERGTIWPLVPFRSRHSSRLVVAKLWLTPHWQRNTKYTNLHLCHITKPSKEAATVPPQAGHMVHCRFQLRPFDFIVFLTTDIGVNCCSNKSPSLLRAGYPWHCARRQRWSSLSLEPLFVRDFRIWKCLTRQQNIASCCLARYTHNNFPEVSLRVNP